MKILMESSLSEDDHSLIYWFLVTISKKIEKVPSKLLATSKPSNLPVRVGPSLFSR